MRTILAIGGGVIKTAHEEIKECARRKLFDVLIHNGGSIFHDFQRTTEKLESHSHSLDALMENPGLNKEASQLVWDWICLNVASEGSLTDICDKADMDVLLFTGLGCDFWQTFKESTHWERMARLAKMDFDRLCFLMEEPFRFICMGSAVIHPEVFTKALAIAKPKDFTADVVDFLDMYRPRTRVAKFGNYFQMEHKDFLTRWLNEGISKFHHLTFSEIMGVGIGTNH